MIFLLQINLVVMEVHSGGVGARESLDVLEGEEVLLQCRWSMVIITVNDC